jgi:hypothetical protein
MRRLAIGALALLSCKMVGDAYRCTQDSQCVLSGDAGRCESSGYCAFADASCQSGRRYGRWAPSPLAASCVPEPFYFYDGFDGAMSPSWSADVENGSNISVDTTKAYRGSGSLAVTVNSGSASYELVHLARPLSLSPVYARAFVWIPSTATLSASADAQLMSYRDNSDDPFPLAALTLRSTFRLGAAVENWSATPATSVASRALPLDSWVCVEWSVKYDDSAAVATSQAGSVVASVAPAPLANPLNSCAIGFAGPPPAAPFTFWIDELAIDGSPIGCDR